MSTHSAAGRTVACQRQMAATHPASNLSTIEFTLTNTVVLHNMRKQQSFAGLRGAAVL